MIASSPSLLENRSTTGRFDPACSLDDATITELVRLATLAPSAFHLQNWSFVAVRTTAAKELLATLAFGQRQICDAAVTCIVCGELGAYAQLSARLQPSVDAGILSPAIQRTWVEMATQAHRASATLQRDEAVRSASLATMALLVAAREMGLDAGVIGGFDPDGIRTAFQLRSCDIPVTLVTMGRAANGNWPQKIRRPPGDVLSFR
jgi:nitroreductase